jgi:hypothetical protein
MGLIESKVVIEEIGIQPLLLDCRRSDYNGLTM